MGDLDETTSSQSVKLLGADATGVESNFLQVSPLGEIKVANFPNETYITANKTILDSEALASVGASNLLNRKVISIYNRGAQDIYYGPTGVTNTTGIPIIKDELVSFDMGENVNIYLVTKSGSATVTIQEYS